MASSTAPASWDPALQTSAFDGIWQWTAVYDTLLTCNQDGTVGPGAAEEFDFTDDNTTLTMTLREGMTFEDGSPVDSAAVKASIEHMQSGGGSGAVRVAGLAIEAPDDRTVVVTAPAPRGLLATYMCLSPGIIASPAAISSPDVDSVPVSSGPYTFDAANSTSGSVMTFVKRDDYWNADAYPYEEIVVTVMTDVTARLNALKTGQVDGATLSAQTFAEAEASQLAITEWVDATNGIVIFDRDGTMVPALAEPKVRQAMNMVFDRAGIAQGLFQGLVDPTTQMFGPETEGFIAELDDEYEFDVEAAKDLMAEAGYADGFTIEIPSRTPQTDQANPLIVQQFAELGITVTETPLAGATAVPELLSGRFPMTYISMPLSSGLWAVGQEIAPDATWNVKKNATPELTALTDAAQRATGEELTETLQEINRYVVDNAWFIPWNNRVAYFGTAEDVSIDGTPDPYFQTPQLKSFK
ncbi:ABC transporter substrate-binding protein [Microbacterium sp. HD4P20]|uniref:ABC transporter substrate-binding protein n=1 Tax=Microbacterium sp. HD4P20 TaxID=2864874 RepID=UPI0020A351D9|nr:ABC transporter substrate-binding protein [Microbacterium sp. HD4P20]MCP2636011.1 ABC transporter substrate-binding protein [Microbacterium sp. HD4P20]